MVNYYFKKAFLLFLCIGIFPSTYAMDGYGILSNISRSISTAISGSKNFVQAPFSYLCNQMNKYNYTLPGSVRHIIETDNSSEENSQVIQRYLARGYSPNIAIGENRTTPLIFAAKHGNLNLVESLLAKNVSVNISDKNGNTPLYFAYESLQKNSEIFDDQIVTKLLESGANVNFCNKREETLLSVAIDNILKKSDTNQKKEINYAILRKLLQNKANLINNSNELLLKAVIKQNPNLVNILLELKANPNVFNNDGNVLSLTINNIFQEKDIQKQEDNYQILEDLLDHGADPDCNFGKSGLMPLIAAIANKNARIVNLLLKNNADVKGYDYNMHGKTPLSIVIDNILQEKNDQKQKINYVILKDLLTHGVNINGIVFQFGTTALLRAIFNKNFKLIDFLLENNADVNISNNRDNAAAYYVIEDILREKDAKKQETNYEILEKLLKRAAKCNFLVDYREHPLVAAIKQDVTLFNLLLKYIDTNGIDINACNKDGNTALSIACKAGDFQTVKELLKHKANPNIKISKTTPLILAIENKNLEMVELLLQCEADVNVADKDGNTPLYFAYELKKNSKEFNNNKLIINLLKRGANPNIKLKNGVIPLLKAVSAQDFEIIKFLIECDADINANDSWYTPLSLAVDTNNLQLVKYLLDNKADPNIKVKNCPLNLAIRNKNLDIIEFLVKHKADVNISDQYGHTPLFVAVDMGDLEIVQYLLDHGANPNIENIERNPLVRAIHQKLDIIKLLLQYQANVNAFCYGSTPLATAIEIDNLEAIKILCKAKASLINMKKSNNKSAFHLAISSAFGIGAPRDQSKKCIETLITYANFNQELTTTKGIELLVALQKQFPHLPKELRLANLKELYIKEYFDSLKKQYQELSALIPYNQTFDDFIEQKFDDFVKEFYRELDVMTCRDSILTQVYKRITQLKKILLIQDNQNQTALQLLQINYPHDPAYIYELAPLLDGTKLDNDFNELKEVIIKISNSEPKNKLSPAELISILDSTLDSNNLALGIYKNCALLENEKQKN